MEEITLTRDDLESLARRLEALEDSFDERERMMLLAMLSLAHEALATRAADEVAGFDGSSPSFGKIVITKETDASSPNLFQVCCGPSNDSPTESLSLNFTKILFT